MRYAALLTNNADDVTAWEQMSPQEAAAARAEEVPKWEALFDDLGPTGALGGYFVFECDSLDEACAWAAKCPGAEHGTIEVRPVYDDEGGPW